MVVTALMLLVSVACFYWGFTAENYFLVGVGIIIAALAIAGRFRSNNADEP